MASLQPIRSTGKWGSTLAAVDISAAAFLIYRLRWAPERQ
jgi:hypothetical protein